MRRTNKEFHPPRWHQREWTRGTLVSMETNPVKALLVSRQTNKTKKGIFNMTPHIIGPVLDGTDQQLNTFLWRCIRGFQLMQHMYDEPIDAPIHPPGDPDPQIIEIHEKLIAEATKLREMGLEEIERKAKEFFEDETTAYEAEVEKITRWRKNLEAMSERVEAWEPPSRDFTGVQYFMRRQLTEALDACTIPNPPECLEGEAFRAQQLEILEKHIELYRKELDKHKEHRRIIAKWLCELDESVPCPEALRGF